MNRARARAWVAGYAVTPHTTPPTTMNWEAFMKVSRYPEFIGLVENNS